MISCPRISDRAFKFTSKLSQKCITLLLGFVFTELLLSFDFFNLRMIVYRYTVFAVHGIKCFLTLSKSFNTDE